MNIDDFVSYSHQFPSEIRPDFAFTIVSQHIFHRVVYQPDLNDSGVLWCIVLQLTHD